MILFEIPEQNHRIQIKDKHRVIRQKKQAVTNNELKRLVLKKVRSRLVYMLDSLGAVQLYLS